MIRLIELGELVCSPQSSIREVTRRMNAIPHLFQVVVNSDSNVLGTVTDGDIRRAILNDAQPDWAIGEYMNRSPLIGTLGRDGENRAALANGKVLFIPVIDDQKVLREIWVDTDQDIAISRALVMAGGYGRRLGEQTKKTPKVMLSVGDKPMLEHILNRLENAGTISIIVSVHYLAEQVQEFIASRNNRAQITLQHEEHPLGTAGAIGLMPPSRDKSPLLVINGDVMTRMDPLAMVSFHRRHNLDATVAVAQHEVEIPFGVIKHDEEGQFLGVDEKPIIRNFVAAGIYYLSPEFFALVPKNRPMDMPELLNLGRKIGLKLGIFPVHEYWRDIGRPDELSRAQVDHNDDVNPSMDF